MKRLLTAGLLWLAVAPAQAWAWPPCCSIPARTFREDAAESKLIVWGTLDHPRKGPNGEFTDVLLGGIVRSHPILRGKSVLTLPRRIAIEDRNRPPSMLIFCDVVKGQLDPLQAVVVSPAAVGYLKGLLAIDARRHDRVLRYCFDFLDHPDPGIAGDALTEFTKTPDRNLATLARQLPAAKLRRWLRDPTTPPVRQRLFGLLIGHCGTADDAVLLRSLTVHLAKKGSSGIDGILIGYTLLDPKDGWAQVRDLLGDSTRDFALRYAALRTVRWFRDVRPEKIEAMALVAAMKPALAHNDFADLIVNDLRAWRCWDLTDQVLALYGKPSHQAMIIRRSIIRYALQCPEKMAAEFVVQRRNTDGEMVAEAEELLRLEAGTQ
jgi:hypothetical protein